MRAPVFTGVPAAGAAGGRSVVTCLVRRLLPRGLLFLFQGFQSQPQGDLDHTPLFLLRCVQLGLSMGDLDFLTIGLVNDMFTERENDDCHYDVMADQRDFDAF